MAREVYSGSKAPFSKRLASVRFTSIEPTSREGCFHRLGADSVAKVGVVDRGRNVRSNSTTSLNLSVLLIINDESILRASGSEKLLQQYLPTAESLAPPD
jgi:hypothetical protein